MTELLSLLFNNISSYFNAIIDFLMFLFDLPSMFLAFVLNLPFFYRVGFEVLFTFIVCFIIIKIRCQLK